jgi:adenylate cyclase
MTVDELSGRLAVILHADVIGSTLLVQRDEQLAHRRMQEAFRRFGKTISSYHGRVRELRGDALLAEFERASDAVAASLAFKSEQARLVDALDDEIRPLLRIGVALGEVIVADNTVTGEGVVLAQRLEQFADPGGLCITPAIREALPKRLPFALDNLGARELKGFDDPIDVYRVALRDGAAPPPPTTAPAAARPGKRRRPGIAVAAILVSIAAAAIYALLARAPEPPPAHAPGSADRPSIVVLPFTNMSGDPQQEYFADGISEDLTTDLSKISGLFVVARNSAFSYKGRQVDVRTVAEELGVRYLLEGSIRRVDDQIRINAQLVDGVSGGHVWAERFDGTMADVFALQDHVNREIVKALQVSLTAAERESLNRVETIDAAAYDILLRGVEQYQRFNAESMLQARRLFLRAAEIDPAYARAYANIALTYATEVNFYWARDREDSIRQGLAYAARAMELDDSIPQIYMTRSSLYLSQRQHEAAIEAALRTVEVHPNYADGHATLAFVLSYSGRLDEALQALERALQINPRSSGVYLGLEGRILFLLGRYDDAVTVLEESIDRNPGFDRTRMHLAASYARLGQLDDAGWAVEEALNINPEITLESERREVLYSRQSDIENYIEALRLAGVPE